MVIAVASAHAPVPGCSTAMPRISRIQPRTAPGTSGLVMVIGELATLHGFGAFVGRFQLRIHPLVAEEAGAVFRDAVTAHQAHRFAHHLRAPAGVPELGSRAENIGQRIQSHEAQKQIRFQLRPCAGRPAGKRHERRPLDPAASRNSFALALSAAVIPAIGAAVAPFLFPADPVRQRPAPRQMPSDALASPVAHTSTSRCSESSRACSPSS